MCWLGPFAILHPLERLAHNSNPGSPTIKTGDLADTDRSRITREAQAMGRLGTHPNIVTVFDLGTEGDESYMVTEVMVGGDVQELLNISASSFHPAATLLLPSNYRLPPCLH